MQDKTSHDVISSRPQPSDGWGGGLYVKSEKYGRDGMHGVSDMKQYRESEEP